MVLPRAVCPPMAAGRGGEAVVCVLNARAGAVGLAGRLSDHDTRRRRIAAKPQI